MRPHLTGIRLHFTGTVQGVGFRPAIAKLAKELRLDGEVRNTATGVTAELHGLSSAIEQFLTSLPTALPAMAHIATQQHNEIPYQIQQGFHINLTEHSAHHITVSVPPDIALCAECVTEMHDPHSRRYRYPFINCTNCGPRYSILHTLPYDRPATSMAPFSMCPACATEYHDPANRRFHAQPVSCFACGPRFWLRDSTGQECATGENALHQAAAWIQRGGIIALRGLGGYHLICDATNDYAVATLRQRKRRPTKPFAVMFPTIEQLHAYLQPTPEERRQLQHPAHPIVLITTRHDDGAQQLSPHVAPDLPWIGAFLPYTPLHMLLLEQLGIPIIATSANIADEPIITEFDTLARHLTGVYDAVLDHDREIVNGCDDSVIAVIGDRPLPVRKGRGMAPHPTRLPIPLAVPTLAVGGQQKNTIAIGWDDQAILSPHIGDLDTLESFATFDRMRETLYRLYRFEPQQIACDLHPDYDTTRWATQQGLPLVRVQHHHAHIQAVMAEYQLNEPVLGLAWDGTGYGSDGMIWGSEVLRVDPQSFQRLAHLRPFPLPGGEKCAREPRRSALGMLCEIFGAAAIPTDDRALATFTPQEIHLLAGLASKPTTIRTTSMGRLFDIAASLLGLCHIARHDADAPMRLEAHFDPNLHVKPYPMPIDGTLIDPRPMARALMLEQNPTVGATRFFHTLAKLIVTLARQEGLPVVLCGGVFQNRVLCTLALEALRETGLPVYLPRIYPPNDGALALGQLLAATQGIQET